MMDGSASDHDLLVRIDSKVDMLVTAKNDHETRLRLVEARPVPPADHEARIRSLEAAKWKARGFLAAIGVLCGLLGGGLAALISGLMGS